MGKRSDREFPAVSLTMQGQTTISGNGLNCGTPPTYTSACTAIDNTTIRDGTTAGQPIFTFVMPSGSSEFRITGITWSGGSDTIYHGMIGNSGSTTSAGPQLRVDHCHFVSYYQTAVRIYDPFAYEVWDHNIFDAGQNNDNGIQVYGQWGTNPPGATPWSQATNFGGSNFTFIENNTFNHGFVNDCTQGGRYVFRYNVVSGNVNPEATVQSHETNEDGDMGCRAWEVYGNYFHNSATYSSEFETSGAGISWGNTSNGVNLLALVNDRDNGSSNYSYAAPPANWGYCGTAKMGVASNWDGNYNLNGSNGWPCITQIGRGQGDLLSGTFPTVCNQTQGCRNYAGTWPREYLEPIYSWDETFTGTGSLVTVNSPNNNIQNNRDYYYQVGGAQTSPTSPFNGTTGTGYGTAANRPTTCTAGPGGTGGASPTGSYGVAYFATDANSGLGELYICTASNTWTAVYEPYTYPHPLTNGGSETSSGSPAAPTNLQAFVE